MFFLRTAMQKWPRALKFWVLALAALQFVAPTWHICEMGGHVMAQDASAHGAMAPGEMRGHFAAIPASASDENAPLHPLICYCAPRPAHHAPAGAQVSAAPDAMHHPTCLALLLQTLPGHIAAPPAIFAVNEEIETHFVPRAQMGVSIAAIRRFRGRAPPLAI